MESSYSVTTLATDLFSAKEPVKLLGSKYTTAKAGPAGIGFSTHRPSTVKTSVKISGAAYVLDKIIIDKCVNVLAADAIDPSVAYTEFTIGGKTYKSFFTEDEVSYSEEAADGLDGLIPIVTFAISEASDDKECGELRDIFKKLVADYNAKGTVEMKDVLHFCDSFYYGFAVNHESITIRDNDVSEETIKQGYEGKMFELSSVFEEVEGKPALKILEGITLRTTKKEKAKKAKAVSAVFEDCLEGKRAIPYEWDEDQQVKIPELSYLDDFIPSPHFYSLLNKIEQRTEKILERLDSGKEGVAAIGKDYINSFIIGKPGTGKTTTAYALGAALRVPVYTIPITKNTEEDTFQGMTKVVDGGFKFVSTDFLEAYTHGGIVILEEVNLADPSVIMGVLGQAVEAPFLLMQDGYKAVRRHPMCIVIGTMNIGTYGAKGVSQAFSSRFKQTYILDDPKAEDFIAILEKQGHSNKKCKWVYDAYTKINNYLKSPEISREEICLNVTLRGCIGALDCMEEGDTPQQAIYNTLVGKVAEVDLELAEDINKNIVRSLPNLSI